MLGHLFKATNSLKIFVIETEIKLKKIGYRTGIFKIFETGNIIRKNK